MKAVVRCADVAEPLSCCESRVAFIDALAAQLLRLELEMRSNLVLEITLLTPHDSSSVSQLWPEHARNRLDESTPPVRFGRQLSSPCCGQGIESRPAVICRRAPCALDPPAVLEALECRIQRTVIDDERVTGALLDGASDTLAVLSAEEQDAQDEEIEGALQQGVAVGRGGFGWHSTRSVSLVG
jgi:hypothetical protein